MDVKYTVHVSDIGWMGTAFRNGEVGGTTGEGKGLEAFGIALEGVPEGVNLGIAYNAHVSDIGWLDHDFVNGEICGTTGQNKKVEAVRIYLFGNDADKYHVYYRLHVADKGNMNWSKDGEINGTVGGGKQAEAIQIIVTDSRTYRPDPTTDTVEQFADLTPPPAPAPSANPAEKLIAVAESQVGYISGSDEDSAYGRYYVGPYAGSWCAYFVRWCCEMAGVPFPATGYCPTVMEWAQQNGRWTGTPQPGFAVLYDFNGNGTPDHIGIVDEVYSSDHILAVEGNCGSPVGVYYKDRSFGILGYVNLF